MDIAKLKETIQKRIALELNDDFALEECWNIERDILTGDIPGTIEYLRSCSEDEFYWLSEVFEEVIDKTQSYELFQVMWNRNETLKNQEYKESYLTNLKYAREALNH